MSTQESDRDAFAILRARAEQNAAQRDVALDALQHLLKLIDLKEFATPERQAIVWHARAVLVEQGRKA